ncbi:TerB family tellurite resistance protein [Paenibacillus sinopodophylli]|uniref:TerB family tellurite resistance protein n=1 Tax=Paenibacillus sinopodophylli TaxID=1837342 RepID=UPI00110C93BE|nr:TerB family tellurite resistance protein [Paenibacillus sinopodophylli]
MFLHFIQSKEHKLAFLELAHVVANADGYVHKKEQNVLQSYMNEMDIQPSELQLTTGKSLKDIVGGLKDQHLKHIFFAEILLLIFADGDYNDDEKKLTADLQQLFELSDETFETIKDWVTRLDQLKIEGLKLILNT